MSDAIHGSKLAVNYLPGYICGTDKRHKRLTDPFLRLQSNQVTIHAYSITKKLNDILRSCICHKNDLWNISDKLLHAFREINNPQGILKLRR